MRLAAFGRSLAMLAIGGIGLDRLLLFPARLAGELHDMSVRMGVAVGWLYQMRHAMRLAGLEFGQLPMMLYMLSRALGGVTESGDRTADVIQRIGLTVEQLRAMRPEDALMAVMRAMSGVGPMEQAYVAGRLFGRGGGPTALALAREFGELQNAMSQASITAQRMAEAAPLVDQLSDSFEMLRNTLTGALLPALNRFAFDLVVLVEIVKRGRFGELASAGAKRIGSKLSTAIGSWLTYAAGGAWWVSAKAKELLAATLKGAGLPWPFALGADTLRRAGRLAETVAETLQATGKHFAGIGDQMADELFSFAEWVRDLRASLAETLKPKVPRPPPPEMPEQPEQPKAKPLNINPFAELWPSVGMERIGAIFWRGPAIGAADIVSEQRKSNSYLAQIRDELRKLGVLSFANE